MRPGPTGFATVGSDDAALGRTHENDGRKPRYKGPMNRREENHSKMKRSITRIRVHGTSVANLSVSSFLLLLVLLLPSNASAASPAPLVLLDGHWTGAMTREGQSWAVNLDRLNT